MVNWSVGFYGFYFDPVSFFFFLQRSTNERNPKNVLAVFESQGALINPHLRSTRDGLAAKKKHKKKARIVWRYTKALCWCLTNSLQPNTVNMTLIESTAIC